MNAYPDYPGAFVSLAKDAAISPCLGVTVENEMKQTAYHPEHGLICDLGTGCTVSYPIEQLDGVFDLYLSLSKVAVQFNSQFFDFRLGDGPLFSVPTECDIPKDSPLRRTSDGDGENIGHWYDTGLFPVIKQVSFPEATRLEVTAAYGARHNALQALIYPALGDLILVPAGTKVPVGHRRILPAEHIRKELCWIGSSVTYGHSASGHYSMADALRDTTPGISCTKFTVSGTTLANTSPASYLARLRLIPEDYRPDAVIVQLSTNDASKGGDLGTVSNSRSDFDETTTAGAMEAIIVHVREHFACPLYFYTGTYFESEPYAHMVRILEELADKWQIGIIDLYHDPQMRAQYKTPYYERVMSDPVHPKKEGYIDWWTPKIREALKDIL